MPFTGDDLPAINAVFELSEYQDLSWLIRCVRAALDVGLEYPVQDANQLENFLQAIPGHAYDVAWFDQRFAEFLPVRDQNDFIVKARLAVQQVITLEPPEPKVHI
jgi:hypothetical protein